MHADKPLITISVSVCLSKAIVIATVVYVSDLLAGPCIFALCT